MVRVLVFGGREYCKADAILYHLQRFVIKHGYISELIHGNARGADKTAAFIAEYNGIKTRAFPADWDAHGKAAGVIRNAQMMKEGRPDWGIGFPGGTGTADMARKLLAAKIPIYDAGCGYGEQ